MTDKEQAKKQEHREWKDKLEKQAQRMRDFLKERDEERDDKMSRPPKGDPQHTQDDIAPGKTDVPAGGTSGGYMGGSAQKKKGETG